MSVKIFRKLNTASRDLNLVQDNVDNAIGDMIKDLFLDGTILNKIELVTGQDNVISHRLGRKLIGWEIVRKRGAGDIYDNQDNNTAPNLTLILRTTANVTVDIRVF